MQHFADIKTGHNKTDYSKTQSFHYVFDGTTMYTQYVMHKEFRSL